MYKTALSLQTYCLNFVCDNLTVFCEMQQTATNHSHGRTFVFKDPELRFNTDLSNQLLTSLSEKGKLSDEYMSIFDPKFSALTRVMIHNSPVTSQGLRVLQGHRLTHLEVTGTRNVAVSDVTGCLGAWTLSNLRLLNISRNKYDITADNPNSEVMTLSRLRRLHTLNVSFTRFDQAGLVIVAENLSCLKVLDISSTDVTDISPLLGCKNRLKSLSMYNIKLDVSSDPVAMVSQLVPLVHLDVSTEPPRSSTPMHGRQFPVRDYLSRPEANPNLVSLDVSGAAPVDPSVLTSFLEGHTALNFLGLALTLMPEYEMFQPESEWYKSHQELKISGEATEDQVSESLRRYLPRSDYILKALRRLFTLTQDTRRLREDILELLLTSMKRHPMDISIQTVATACLCNMVACDDSVRIHPALLSTCAEVVLTAMANFPDDRQVQNNALITLCDGSSLGILNTDRIRCMEMAMQCLNRLDDVSIINQSVFIWSYLSYKLSSEERAAVGKMATNTRTLLTVLQGGMMHYENDPTAELILGILWNLTDECPTACNSFLNEGGVELVSNLLRLTVNEDRSEEVQLTCLGILSNIAEVKTLCHRLMQERFIKLIRRIMLGGGTKVGFFSAHILVHLCMEGDAAWATLGDLNRNDILRDLKTAVSRFDHSATDLGVYRSFQPFYLVMARPEPPLQLWAVWGIHYYCSADGKHYLTLLDNEGGQKHIEKLMMTTDLDPSVKTMCQDLLVMLDRHKGQQL